jgi:small conductance mechanosensitive channel
VDIFVRPWVNTSDYFNVKLSLIEAIKKKFDEEKIKIPFPQRDVYLYQK